MDRVGGFDRVSLSCILDGMEDMADGAGYNLHRFNMAWNCEMAPTAEIDSRGSTLS